MGRRAIDVGDFVRDVRSGLSDSDLMNKYGLAKEVLYEIFEKLIKMGKIHDSDLTKDDSKSSEPNLSLASTCKHCGSLLLADSEECSHCLAERVAQLIDEKEKSHDLNAVASAKQLDTPEHERPKPSAEPPPPVQGEPFLSETIHGSVRGLDETKRATPGVIHKRKRITRPALVGGVFLAVLAIAAVIFHHPEILSPYYSVPHAPAWTPPVKTRPESPKVSVAPAVQERTDPAPLPQVKGKSRDLEAQVLIAERAAQEKREREEKIPASVEEVISAGDSSMAGLPSAVDEISKMPAIAETETVSSVVKKENETLTPAESSDATITNTTAAVPPSSERTIEASEPTTKAETSQEEASPEKMIDIASSLPKAVKEGDLGKVDLMLGMGMNVNSVDEEGSSLLLIAVRSGNEPLVDLLLRNGADRSFKDKNGFTALARACEDGNARVVNLLLKHDERKGAPELLDACEKGRIRCASLMLDNGANLNAKDGTGATPLMLAAGKGNLDLVIALLNKGADLAAKDNKGFTALGWAFSPLSADTTPFQVRREIIRILKQYGKGKVRDPLAY